MFGDLGFVFFVSKGNLFDVYFLGISIQSNFNGSNTFGT